MKTTTPNYASGFNEGGTYFAHTTVTPTDLGFRPRPRPTYDVVPRVSEIIAPQAERVTEGYLAPAARNTEKPSALERMANIAFQPF